MGSRLYKNSMGLGRMKLLQELVEEKEIDYSTIIEEAIRQYPGLRNKRGGRIQSAVKGAAKFFRNPLVAATGAVMAINAYDQYQKNKRYTTRFFAKTPAERKMYKEIIQMMTQSGKYKLKKTKYVGGGREWILKRVNV